MIILFTSLKAFTMRYSKQHLIFYINIVFIIGLLFYTGCDPEDVPNKNPNIIETPRNLDEDRSFVSPPAVQQPIYACASTVVVKHFIVGAVIDVYVDGVKVSSETGTWHGGMPIKVPSPLTEGQQVYATQTFQGATSDPSNTVPVTNYLEDYPGGLPAPRISRTPLLECGRAIGIADAVPGARVTAFAQNPDGTGGFNPPVEIGSIADFGYMFVAPLEEGARVWLVQTLCTETSGNSTVQNVQPEPSAIPAPSADPKPIDGADIVVIWGNGGYPNELLNGATIEIKDGSTTVGGQPAPGGGQQVFVNPRIDASKTYSITQKLCNSSPPTNVTPEPCSALKAPTIYPPNVNDTQIEVIDYYPGAQILVFADGEEIGHTGPSIIPLKRPIEANETIIVIQRLGNCTSATAFSIPARCNQGEFTNTCGEDWPAYRQSGARDGNQPHSTKLANAALVKKLKEKWRFTPGETLPRGFTSSPIVYKNKVYVAGSNGRLYALNANKWRPSLDFPTLRERPEDV